MRKTFAGTVLCAVFLLSCSENPHIPLAYGDPGSANVIVSVGKVGALGKIRNIELRTLYISLSAPGETTVRDTFPLSGNGEITISKTYSNLASLLKTWTLTAESRDVDGVVIHSGDTSFIVPARSSIPVFLSLDARYAMLKANFFPIRDSVTRCEVLVDGVKEDDSSFAKQALVGDTVKLSYNYLRTRVSQRVKLDVYGTMWGFDTLLYTGDTLVNPLPAANVTYSIALRWVGPAAPPPGSATMTVVLGAVGTTTVSGELEDYFTSTGGMSTTRLGKHEFTVTMLSNGKVLACGGYDGSNVLNSVEMYDPAAGVWTQKSPMNQRRYAHSAVLLGNGRVLVLSGVDQTYPPPLNTAEIYDPVSDTWTLTGNMITGRVGPNAIVLKSGKVLVAGGAGNGYGDFNSSEIFDPSSGSWEAAGDMASTRRGVTCSDVALLEDGKVLIAGGIDNRTCELFDPESQTWTLTGAMLADQNSGFTLVTLPGGEIMAAGGQQFYTAIVTDQVEHYDPVNGSWHLSTPLPEIRVCASADLLPDGKVLVAGGALSASSATTTATALLYDPLSETWSEAGTMKSPRCYHNSVVLQNGRVLIVGGSDPQNNVLSSAELYYR